MLAGAAGVPACRSLTNVNNITRAIISIDGGTDMAHDGAASITKASLLARFGAPSRPFAASRRNQPHFTNHRSLLTNQAQSSHSARPIEAHVTTLQPLSPLTHHDKINRKPRRLEISVSHRKQTMNPLINRQLSGTSQKRLSAPKCDATARKKTILESFSHPHPKSQSSS
jgi:hypothetical protein